MKNKKIPYSFALPIIASCESGLPLHSLTGNLFMNEFSEISIKKLVEKNQHPFLGQCGIYKLYHLAYPDRFYIGSARRTRHKKESQRGFYRRFIEHLNHIKNKKHTSLALQNVVELHGINGLRFEILEIIGNAKRVEILKREQYYMDTLRP